MADTKTSAGKVPIFCINLGRRQDRWNEFMSQEGIRNLGKDAVKRWEAVDGATLDINADNRISVRVKRNIGKKLRRAWEDINSPGAVGCYLSHVGLWQWLVQSGTDLCIIMEDDCVVPADFGGKIRQLWEESAVINNKRYDLCILHRRCGVVSGLGGDGDGDGGDGGNGGDGGDEKIERLDTFHNTTAYIITRDCAKRLLDEIFPIQVHIDRMMAMYKILYGLRMYRVKENWLNITSSGSKSDINIEVCHFCEIPSDFNRTLQSMSKVDFTIGRISQILAVVILVSLAGARLASPVS